MKKGKSTNGLMKHIRDNHKIDVNGSVEKQQLLNMGYYHGFKSSLYIKTKDNKQEFREFKEVKAIYDFDLATKVVLYPMLVLVETALKNRLIDFLVKNERCDIEYIYSTKLRGYMSKEAGSSKYRKQLKKRLELKGKIDSTIAYHYGKKHPAIEHFFHENKSIPLWAYFEVITFGELGNFISCMNKELKIGFTKSVFYSIKEIDITGIEIENIIFSLVGLRNATMHNSMLFDCRFSHHDSSKQIKEFVKKHTKIKDINFDILTDFFIVLTFILKNLNVTKTELKKHVRDYDDNREKLFKAIPFETYTKIMGTESQKKMKQLKSFVSK